MEHYVILLTPGRFAAGRLPVGAGNGGEKGPAEMGSGRLRMRYDFLPYIYCSSAEYVRMGSGVDQNQDKPFPGKLPH